MGKTGFSNIQKELLKMFDHNIPEEQLIEIRRLLAAYFAGKASDEADRLWKEKGWTDETMEKWAQAHMRKNS